MCNVRNTILLLTCFLLLTVGANGVYAATVDFSINGDITLNSSTTVNGGSTGVISNMASGSFDNTSFTTGYIDDGMGGILNLEINIFTLSSIDINATPLAFNLAGHDGSAPTIAFKASDNSFVYIEYADVNPGPQNFISLSDAGHSFNGLDSAHSYFQGEWVINSYSPTVPVPATVWLFGSGLIGLIGIARRKAG